MDWHGLWHVAVLGSTLFAAAGVVLLGVATLVFDEPPPGLTRARPVILALVGAAGALVGLEWLGVH
jgi:hypothetical protein